MLRFKDLTESELNRLDEQAILGLKNSAVGLAKRLPTHMAKEEYEQIAEYDKMLDYINKKGR